MAGGSCVAHKGIPSSDTAQFRSPVRLTLFRAVLPINAFRQQSDPDGRYAAVDSSTHGGDTCTMSQTNDDGQETTDTSVTRPPDPSEPPLQALLPNFDRVSRSSFSKGTVSRRRIVRAAIVFVALAVVIALILIGATYLASR